MFCPDCGGICDSRGLCPACEQRARERAVRNGPVAPFRISAGKRRALDGTLDIKARHLVIRKKMVGVNIKNSIEYRDIEQIAFSRAAGETRGFLALRRRGDTFPVAGSLWEAERSPMALTFNWMKSNAFEEVYLFLDRQTNAHRALAARAGYPSRSGWKYCPACGSRDIYNPFFHGADYHTLKGIFMCRVCGYRWNAQRSDGAI